MAKRVLIPLDESPEAEAVVDVAADLARGGGATVRLLHVAPVPDNVVSDGRIVAYADQEGARLESAAVDYLRAVEARLGVPAERVVRFGDPVREILKEADAFTADLILMSTKAPSGLARLVLGSVAEHVLGRAAAPVLLYRASRERAG